MAMNRKIREAIINAIREEKAVTVDEVVEIELVNYFITGNIALT